LSLAGRCGPASLGRCGRSAIFVLGTIVERRADAVLCSVRNISGTSSIKQTPFYTIHTKLGAKMVEFAGFAMPVQYSGIMEEHLAVRKSVGAFDVSHMGEFTIHGKDALAFLQKLTVNDVSKLRKGKVQYSALCYEDGGIIDDLLVYRMPDHYTVVVNAANTSKDFEWLQSNLFGDVKLVDVSDATALIAVQGPKAFATLQKLTKENLSTIEYYSFIQGTLADVPMTISRTGYTGEPGCELYFDANREKAEKVWTAIFEAGKEFDIKPVGLGARDTLRLEMGYCLYGSDIDRTTNPLEAGLGWITKFNKGDFNGRSAMLKMKEQGLKRSLVGFAIPDRIIARHGNEIRYDGKAVGTVTSGTFSPSLQKSIGLGYVPYDLKDPGTTVTVAIREKEVPATVTSVPFIRKK
jgi:aminomethyltransferase